MFLKIALGLVLVSVLPCESQNRFVEVPFDGDVQRAAPPQHGRLLQSSRRASSSVQPSFTGISANQPLALNDQLLQTRRTNPVVVNPVVSTPRQQFINLGSDPSGSPLTAASIQDALDSHPHRLQPSRANQVRGSPRGRIPTEPVAVTHLGSPSNAGTSEFATHQPVPMFNFEHRSSLIPSGPENEYQTSNFPQAPSSQRLTQVDYQPQPTEPRQPVLKPWEPITQRPLLSSRGNSNFPSLARAQPVAPPTQTFQLRPTQTNQQISLSPRAPDYFVNVQPTARPTGRVAPNHQNIQRTHLNQQIPQYEIDDQKRNDEEERIFREQAESAKYSFASQIDDNISGNQHHREEVRDGSAVKGSYAYSDGYVKRVVFYEADDKGFRIVKEEEEPLGDGPQVNPKGQADVRTYVSGNDLQYSITAADIQDQQANQVADRRFIQ